MNLYALSSLLAGTTVLGIGLFVSLKNRKSDVNRSFGILEFTLSVWIFGCFTQSFVQSREIAYVADHILYLGVICYPVAFLNFIYAYMKLEKSRRVFLSTIGLTLFFLTFNLYEPIRKYFISSVGRQYHFRFIAVGAPLWYALVVFVSWSLMFGLYLMWKRLRDVRIDQLERQKAKYLLISNLILDIGGLMYFGLVVNIETPPLDNFLAMTFTFMMAYAIVRHQLMDIEVVIKRTLRFAGLVGFAVFFMAIVPKYLLELFGIPRVVADVGGAVIIAAFFGQVRDWLINVTDRYLFQKKYDFRELMRGFTDELTTVLDLKRLIQMTMETLIDTVKLESCSLLLLNKDTRKYEIAGSKGTNGKQIVLEEQEPFITFLRETHEPIVLKGPLAKVRYPEEITQRVQQLNALVCLPLHIHEDLIGVLCLGKKKSDEEFSKSDLDDLLDLAKTLSVGITNAQQLDELTKTQAKAAQSEKLAVIGTLSAGINHEICNPLGIVKAQCEAFLLDQEDGILIGKSSQELLERMSTIMRGALKQIDRATAITQKLSNFAKPIKDAVAEPVSIAQEVDEVLLLVGHDLKLEKIEVVKEIQPDLPQIMVDRRQFQEVLFNLVRNAGQAIKPPGTIWVRAHTEGEHQVRIEIADTGGGIPPDKLEKIYDPFFTTKEPGKGTGLGLFIVRQIVERNKGRISLESAVGKGTTFFLDFPAAKPAPETAGARA